MEKELAFNKDKIIVRQGSIEFLEFDRLKEEAQNLAQHIKTVKVTEETAKQSKKLLAAVNNKIKDLEGQRISIKKNMLEPYEIFDNQIKEIVSIVKEADSVVREQIRALEEVEREEKRAQIEDIFDKRKDLYTLGMLINFEDFLQPKHLNKTQSIDATEKEMIAFLERTEKDVEVLQRLPNVEGHINAYLECFDLAIAMSKVQAQKERRERIQQSQAVSNNKSSKVVKIFAVYDQKDFLLVEMYMKNNRIKFTVEDGM